MALAPFFERVYGAVGGHLAISRESLTSLLGQVTVAIRCIDDMSQNEIWAAEMATNLVARLYPKISISGPALQSIKLRELAVAINPSIEFDEGGEAATHTICIGPEVAAQAIYPSASGWVASVAHSPASRSGLSNPYAAGMSAAMACSEVFRRVFLKGQAEADVSVSLLKFDSSTGIDLELSPVEIGATLFAGVGAVGSAALWGISRHQGLGGEIHLVDHESVELSNLQRYVLCKFLDTGRSKVEIGKEALSKSGLLVQTSVMRLEEFAAQAGNMLLPTIVISVDNIGGRRAAQALLPKLAINGWTGDHALGSSWHIFSSNSACLACLYHPKGQGVSAIDQAAKAFGLSPERAALLWVTRQPLSSTDITQIAGALGVKESILRPWRKKPIGEIYTDVVCGAVPIAVKGIGKVEMVPLAHQSAIAGLLMASELIKRLSSQLNSLSSVETLTSWDNVLQPPPVIWGKPRPREDGCICGDADYQGVYKRKWGS